MQNAIFLFAIFNEESRCRKTFVKWLQKSLLTEFSKIQELKHKYEATIIALNLDF